MLSLWGQSKPDRPPLAGPRGTRHEGPGWSVGVTGAGLTNAFWMRPGTVLMQLLPYGWLLPEGELIRTGLSRDMSLSLNGTYLQVRHLQPCSARKSFPHLGCSSSRRRCANVYGCAAGWRCGEPEGCELLSCCCSTPQWDV